MAVFRGFILAMLCALTAGQWMTDFDKHFQIQCPDQEVITGLDSEHDNHHEDRVWNISCSLTPHEIDLGNCEWSGYVNNYDELLEYQCPAEMVITGIESIHDNHREDRQYSFKCCSTIAAVAHRCELTAYVNEYDKVLNYEVPDGYILKGVYSVHDNHHEDRIFKFNICKLDLASVVIG